MVSYPNIIITTSHSPSDQARMLAKLLRHVIPNSHYEHRGSKNQQFLTELALNRQAVFLLVLQSNGNKISRIIVQKVTTKGLILLPQYLKFYQFIDPKIYGWKSLPAKGPLSISQEGRTTDSVLVDFMETYFTLIIGKKTELWLLLDKTNGTTFMQFVDSLTMKPIAFMQVAVKEKKVR